MNIMDRPILCAYILGGCPESHWDTVIREYCIEMGKDPSLTDAFIRILNIKDSYGDLRHLMVRHILNYQARAQQIVCLYDRDNQLISVY